MKENFLAPEQYQYNSTILSDLENISEDDLPAFNEKIDIYKILKVCKPKISNFEPKISNSICLAAGLGPYPPWHPLPKPLNILLK